MLYLVLKHDCTSFSKNVKSYIILDGTRILNNYLYVYALSRPRGRLYVVLRIVIIIIVVKINKTYYTRALCSHTHIRSHTNTHARA